MAEMLDYGRRLNRRWDQAAAANRMRRLSIPLDRRVASLSGGQRAQVALGLALAKRPDLLLLDEPLANLDPLARRYFLQELVTAAADDGITVVLSSHLIADLERACDHLLLLDRGTLRLAGGIEDLLDDHGMAWGPRLPPERGLLGRQVIRRVDRPGETRLWTRGGRDPLPPGWQTCRLSLEDLVLSYLQAPGPTPVPEAVGP